MANAKVTASVRKAKSKVKLCQRCLPGKQNPVTRGTSLLCENCRVHLSHKRKELREKGETEMLDEATFIQRFPALHNRGLCQRCPRSLGRLAFSSGLCRYCSNSLTILKKKIRQKNPWAKMPTPQAFIRDWPKRAFFKDGKYYIVS